jgi:hypothetical protein
MADQPNIPDSAGIPAPTPTSELDADLKEVLDRSLKFLRRITTAMGVIVLVVVIVASVLVRWALTEHSRVDQYLGGQCPFYYTVAVLPVPASTSTVGVNLVEGARSALVRQACPETLPPPSAELLLLGRKYHILIRY